MKLINDFSNSLLNRRELRLSLPGSSNPSLVEVQKNLAEHFKVSEDHIAVKKVSNQFGSHEFMVEAMIYGSAEAKMSIEPKPKQKKGASA